LPNDLPNDLLIAENCPMTLPNDLLIAENCRMTLPNDENFVDSSFATFVLMILFNVPK
jgi:hypothetical protein